MPVSTPNVGSLRKLVVVIEVLVAQHQAKDPLSHQCLNPVLNVTSIATVGEATGEPTDQSKATIHLPQRQRPAFEVMSPPSKPAITARRSTASIETASRYTLSASGPS